VAYQTQVMVGAQKKGWDDPPFFWIWSICAAEREGRPGKPGAHQDDLSPVYEAVGDWGRSIV